MKSKRFRKFIECGCCGMYHPLKYEGDCRNDDYRYDYDELPDNADIISLEEQTYGFSDGVFTKLV